MATGSTFFSLHFELRYIAPVEHINRGRRWSDIVVRLKFASNQSTIASHDNATSRKGKTSGKLKVKPDRPCISDSARS